MSAPLPRKTMPASASASSCSSAMGAASAQAGTAVASPPPPLSLRVSSVNSLKRNDSTALRLPIT